MFGLDMTLFRHLYRLKLAREVESGSRKGSKWARTWVWIDHDGTPSGTALREDVNRQVLYQL